MTETTAPKPRLGILDYGMGNLRSVHRAFLTVGADAEIIDHPHQMSGRDALVFPGQGAIVDTMKLLKERDWIGFLTDWIQQDRPFFGICLGLQALFNYSEEGETQGLGSFAGSVRRFSFSNDSGYKIPHMGWNHVQFRNGNDLLTAEIDPSMDQFYFVHSYYVVPDDKELVWGETQYGDLTFCSAIQRGNLVATQFHPEKSQAKGLQLYRNFLNSVNSYCGY